MAADQLGNGIDLLGGKGDHGGAARQARQFARAHKCEFGKARAGFDMGGWQQFRDEGAGGFRAQKQRFLDAPGAQYPVGKDMAALGIGGKLHFIDG